MEWTPATLDEIIDHVRADRLDLDAWVDALREEEVRSLLGEVQARLEALPVPIGPNAGGPLVDERRAYERLAGRLRGRRGDHDALVEAERAVWLRGGPHLPYLRVLKRVGRLTEAAVLGRTLLLREHCPDREGIEAFLDDLSDPPQGWHDAIARFAREPSLVGWRELWRFTPEEVLAERMRYTLHLLQRLDVDDDLVFELATADGIIPDAVEMVERGVVDPRVVEARGRDSTPDVQALWLGLAARAACVRGDRLGTVRLLRACLAQDDEAIDRDVAFVRGHADAELHDMLDRAGIPRA